MMNKTPVYGVLSWTLSLLVASCLLLQSVPARSNGCGVVGDQNSVILDHFDNSTTGTAYGALSYQAGLPELGQAGSFGTSIYVKYALPSLGSSGTIEMWLKPQVLPPPTSNAGLLNFNWNNTGSYPSAGHIMHMQRTADSPTPPTPASTLTYGAWARNPVLYGTSAIPLGQWTHVAVSWSPSGSKLYINGVPESTTPNNLAPSFNPSNWAYLNYWGSSSFESLIDEFHVSNIQRTDAEILAHASCMQAAVPSLSTWSLIGLVVLIPLVAAGIGALRRKVWSAEV